MVARVYGAPRAAGPWSGFVCVFSHAPNENAFVLRRVRHRAPRALTLRLLRPLGVVVIRLSVGCIMMPEVGSSRRLLAKLARAAALYEENQLLRDKVRRLEAHVAELEKNYYNI